MPKKNCQQKIISSINNYSTDNIMVKALGVGGPPGSDDEYGLEDEEERHMLVELSSAHGRKKSARELFDTTTSSSSDGVGSCVARLWPGVLFTLLLLGVYQLGARSSSGEHKALQGSGTGENRTSYKVFFGGEKSPAEEETAEKSTVKAGSFTLERLKATRSEGEKIISLLEEYYFGKEQAYKMLMTAWAAVWDFEATAAPEKSARNEKLIDTMARALVTDEQKTFLMGGIGSSVMAGHDNCHYDSYQTQMERLWQPVWEAAGMNFVFQNAGEGGGCGDSHQNQHFCVKQNISPDVDIVHYSWTYFEGGSAHAVHEDLIRWAQMLPKQPIVHILAVGGGDPANMYQELINHYAIYGYNLLEMRSALVRGGHDYESEKNREVDPFDRFGWGYVGDGYHDTTRYGEQAEEVRKKSLGVVMRNWVSILYTDYFRYDHVVDTHSNVICCTVLVL